MCAMIRAVAHMTPTPTLAEAVKNAVDEGTYSIYGLARKIAGPHADDRTVQRWRHALKRCLKGAIPKDQAVIDAITETLDLPKFTRAAAVRVAASRQELLEARVAALEDVVARLTEQQGGEGTPPKPRPEPQAPRTPKRL